MIGGHAAGTAAMAAQSNRPAQLVMIADLQKRLRQEGQVVDFVLGVPEKWSDPKGGTGGLPEF